MLFYYNWFITPKGNDNNYRQSDWIMVQLPVISLGTECEYNNSLDTTSAHVLGGYLLYVNITTPWIPQVHMF